MKKQIFFCVVDIHMYGCSSVGTSTKRKGGRCIDWQAICTYLRYWVPSARYRYFRLSDTDEALQEEPL
jgi:hypothetical protein